MVHPKIKAFREEQRSLNPITGRGGIRCSMHGCSKYESLLAESRKRDAELRLIKPGDPGYSLAVERLTIADQQKNGHIYYCDGSFKTKATQTVEQKNRTAYKKWKDGPGW